MPTIMLCAGSPLLSMKRKRSSQRTLTRGAKSSKGAAWLGRGTLGRASCADVQGGETIKTRMAEITKWEGLRLMSSGSRTESGGACEDWKPNAPYSRGAGGGRRRDNG